MVFVIVSFRHKGLERLYRDGSKKGVQAAHVPKLLRVLSLLDVAQTPDDLAISSFRTPPQRGPGRALVDLGERQLASDVPLR